MSVHAEDDSNPERLMANLKSQVSGVRGAVLSAHGLAMAGHGLERDAVDELAAMSSGLFSHARQAVRAFGQSPDGGDRQVAIEMDGLTLFAASVGATGILTVLTERETDAAVLGSEIGRVIERLQPFLATQPRYVARWQGWTAQGLQGEKCRRTAEYAGLALSVTGRELRCDASTPTPGRFKEALKSRVNERNNLHYELKAAYSRA